MISVPFPYIGHRHKCLPAGQAGETTAGLAGANLLTLPHAAFHLFIPSTNFLSLKSYKEHKTLCNDAGIADTT